MLGVLPNTVVCWDVGHLFPYNHVVDFNLNEFYQLSNSDLKAFLIALQYPSLSFYHLFIIIHVLIFVVLFFWFDWV